MESKKNIAQAIIKVMAQVKGMEKKSTVGKGQYAYKGTRDQDVKEVFNEALSKNGLCIIPTDIQEDVKVDRWQEGGKSKQSIFTSVKTKYLLLHESGESVELCGYGHGIDNQDKGAGKATTYALKYCLLYTFLTPVGKIDDADTTHSNDIDSPNVDVNAEILKKCKTIEELKNAFVMLHGAEQKRLVNLKDELKKRLQ